MKKENCFKRFFNGLVEANIMAYTNNGTFNIYGKRVK